VHLYLADSTSQAHLDGTTTGIVVMIVVMLPALAFFIGLIYWSARDPGDRKGHLQPAGGQGAVGAAERPMATAGGHGASRLLADPVEHGEEAPAS
jgi:hypothetical protein